jgi:hypothetical protein
MRDDDLHAGRLADDAAQRPDAARRDVVDQPAHADAADFLVVRQREVERTLEPAAQELWNQRESGRTETLHVGDPAPVDAVAFGRRRERRPGPRLAVDRNDVGVSGQHDASVRDVAVLRRQRREQVGLAPVVVESERRVDAVPGEPGSHPVDQCEVGLAARGVEGDQRADHLPGGEPGGVGRSFPGGTAGDGGSVHRGFRPAHLHPGAWSERQG